MNYTAIAVIRWGARLAGIVIIALILASFFGWPNFAGSLGVHSAVPILKIKWLSTIVSYIVGWKWEQHAGVMIVMLYLVYGVIDPGEFFMPFAILMALPGLMYILCSMEWDVLPDKKLTPDRRH